jgi:hypothetical protein
MKSHLQGHIKNLLRHDDYLNFTAEPIVARQRRLASDLELNVENASSYDVSQTSQRIIKTEVFAEKENSDVITINAKFGSKKRKLCDGDEDESTRQVEVIDSKSFLAEISNDSSTAQSKRSRMEVAYYDPASDMIIRPRFDVDESKVDDFNRRLKCEIEDSNSSTEVELIPYCSSVSFVEKIKTEISPNEISPTSNEFNIEDHCYFASPSNSSDSDQKLMIDEVDEIDDQLSAETEMLELQRIVDSCRDDFLNEEETQIHHFVPLIGSEIEVNSSAFTHELPKYVKKISSSVSKPKIDIEAKKIVSKVVSLPKEAEEVSEAVKDQALACIQELQARGATTDELTCKICDPAKSFTAYTTLLSHLRSHAQIRFANYI